MLTSIPPHICIVVFGFIPKTKFADHMKRCKIEEYYADAAGKITK